MNVNLEELIFDLESDVDDNKIKAARILAQVGDASVLPHLEKQLSSPNQTVRYFVKKAIDAIKNKSNVSASSIPIQNITPKVSIKENEPVQPLNKPSSILNLGDSLKENKIVTTSTPSVTPINKEIDISDSELLTRISKLPDDQKVIELTKVFNEGDYDLFDNVIITKISELASIEKNPDIASLYIKIVGKYGGNSFLTSIAKFLKSSNSKLIAAALDALYYIKDKNLSTIIPQFIRHTDKDVQSSAIAALWSCDNEKSKQIIDKMLNAEEREYRYIAALAISKIPDDKTLELAMSIFYNEEDPEIFKIGALSIQKKANENNYYKLKEIVDTLPSQKANFIKQIIDKFDTPHKDDIEVSVVGTEISVDINAEEEKEKERLKKITAAKGDKKNIKTTQEETYTEKDLEIDENNLKPVQILLTEIGSKKEVERIRAVKMLIAHLNKGVNSETKEQIMFALEIALGDKSAKVRELVNSVLNKK